MGLFSVTGSVIAILAGELFLGEATGHYNGSGTLAIHSQRHPATTCVGDFTSSAELGGKGQLHCTDGTTSTFHFKRLSIKRGYGEGSTNRGPMSFAYGLSVDEARPHLNLPDSKKLEHNGTELELVDVARP